jgi:hypothetical protein
MLRADVDAYNKLSPDQKTGLKGQTILGEMQAALGFAELQGSFAGVLKSVQEANEDTRATWAEMVNQTVDKAQRKRDYTAADIANNTDNIAWQIAVLKYVDKSFDIDGSIADYVQESGINEKIAKEQAGAESVINDGDSVIENAETVVEGEQGVGETKYALKKDSSGNTYVDIDKSIVKDTDSPKQIAQTLSDVVRTKFNDFINVKGQKIGINQKTAHEWVRSQDVSSLLRMDKSKFIDKANAFGNADELLQAAKNYIGEATKHARKDSFVEFARGVVDFKVGDNGYTADIIVGTTQSGVAVLYDIVNIQNKKIVASESDTTQSRRHETPATDNSISQTERKVNPESEKNIDKADLTDKTAKTAQEGEKKSERGSDSKSAEKSGEVKDEGKATEKSSEGKNKSTESKKSETKISEKKALTDEQRREKARERAEKLLKWNEEQRPTAKELNEAREYVKGFDNLDINRRMAIIRTIRSAEGKVDKKTLKGVANVMAAIPKADVEIRFAEGLGGDKGGLYTHVGNKTLLVIDRGTDFKKTIQGTIAHELVHYLENRKEYKEFAEYVMKRVKPEMKAEITKQYTEHYKAIFAAEARASGVAEADIEKAVAERMATDKFKALIDSEIVAKYVGKALNNEKLLKKYADKDKKLIARVGEWLGRTVTSLKKNKDVDKEAVKVAEDMAFRVTVLLQSETVGESRGTKYLFAGNKAKTADKLKLATAKEMLENGADSETVRRETGWFKGYDGKWRFEIDDSNMKIIKEYLLLKEGRYTLDEVISHDGLFEAYPELAKMEVVVQRGGFAQGAVGAYIADQDILALNSAIYLRDEDVKKVIVHEIQHKIQRLEGFARGSSPDYWEKKGITEEEYNDFVAKTERALAKAKKGLSESDMERLNEYFDLGKKQDELYSKLDFKNIFDEEKNSEMQKILDQISPIEKRHDELYDYLYYQPWFSRINELYYQTEIGDKLNTVFYKNTAGEIEARNAAERINLSAEERKNTQPDIDREDVVFAESADNLSIIANLKDTQGNSYGRAVFLDTKVFNGINTRNWWRVVEANLNNRIQKSGTAIMFIYDESGNQQILEFARPNERVNNHPVLGELYRTQDNISKLSVIHVDEIVDVSADSNPYYTLPTKNTWIDQNGWLHRYAYVVDSLKNVIYKVNFDIAKTKDGRHLLYSMRGKIERIGDADVSSLIFEERDSRRTTDSNISIPQKSDLSTDSLKKDLSDTKADLSDKPKKVGKDGTELNEQGEVKDEFFEAAVLRSLGDRQSDTDTAESRREKAERMIESRKTKFNKLIANAEKIKRKLESFGKDADPELIKKTKKQYSEILFELGSLQRDMRVMGYDLNAENRLIEQQKEQIENQKEQIKTLKQQKAELERIEREDRIMRDLDKREAARAAKLYAKQKADFGKVYNEKEIKGHIKDMMERGLISQFFGGQYKPNLDKKTINGIAEYIAMQLNLLGTAEGKAAKSLLFAATNDIVKRMTFTDAESGQELYLNKIVDEETAKQFAEFIEGDLIDMFRNIGTVNAHAELMRRYKLIEQEYLDKGKQAKERQEWGKELPKTYQAALKIKRLAAQGKGSFSDSVELIAKELGKIVDESGHLHFGRIDGAMKELLRFFEAEALKAQSERGQLSEDARVTDDALTWSVNPALQAQVEQYLRLRKDREGKALTAEEMKLVGDILRGMKTTIERYNKEFINGHWVDIESAATEEVTDLIALADIEKNKKFKTKIGEFLGGKVGKAVNEAYFYKILSPENVLSALEGYRKGGLLQSMYHSVREAQSKSATMWTRMLKPFQEFLDDKENRWEGNEEQGGKNGKKYSYRDKLNVKVINVNGSEMTLGEGINLLMLTKREAAHAGLIEGGYKTFDKDGNRHTVKLTDIPAARDMIYSQLDSTDRAFLDMAEKFFNETASKIKYDADMKIFGFSNNSEGYYVPMVRDRYARMKGVTDARFSIGEFITLYSPSFTKNLVENANALEGQNIMSLIENHARGLADYSELYLPLKAFDRFYNRGVALNDGEVRSVREVLNTEIWDGTERYLKDLFSDIQHQRDSRDNVVDSIVGSLRSAWVNSVLGANIKVVATQTTSLGAATQVIEPRFITQAAAVIGKRDVSELRERAYKYSDIIEARSFDMGALKAQGNIEKVSKIGEKSGYLIGWMDERVCLSIFHAAELKVQEQDGFAVGTEKNAQKAAKIADEAIFTTQAMSDATERSALQRSTSEIGKLFSMFTSDTVKNLSHLWGNVMKYNAHKARADAGEAGYADMLKQDKAELGRSVRTLAITGVMMGLITQAFKYLFAKEEEEPEEKVKDLAIDVVSSTLNILPIVSDIADKLFLDYDMSLNVLDVANDTIESVGKGFKLTGKAISGQYVSAKDVTGAVVDITKSGLSLVGVPVSPVERTVRGLMRRFTPSVIYGYDAVFSNPSYTSDLKKAVESGDEALAEHILSSLYKNEVAGVYASEELEEVARLYSLTDTDGKHYDVLPQKVAAEVNGVKLTRTQRRQFNATYSRASAEVVKLIGSAYYQDLSDEQRAKAIKNIYSLYYNRAASEVTDKEWTNAQAYAALTDNYSALFASQAFKSGLEATKDAQGKEVTVKEQNEAYLKSLGLSEGDYTVISYANGMRSKSNKAALLTYINSLSLSDDVKAQVAQTLGFEVKDGKVVEKSE